MRIYDVYQAILHDLQRICKDYVLEHCDMVWDDGISWEYGCGYITISYTECKSMETKMTSIGLDELLEWGDENVK